MREIAPQDPSIATSGVIHTNGVNNNEQLMLYNDSLYGLRLTFADGSIGIIPPSWNKDYIIKNMPMGDVQWSLYNQIVATGYPMSSLYGELYEDGEHVASVNAGMQRGFTLTGGNVVSGSTQSIVNDGNPTATQIVEATVSGAPSSSIIIKTDGTIDFAELIANVVTPFLQSFPGTTVVLKLGSATRDVEVLHNMTIDNVLNVNGASSLDNGLIVTSGTGNITFSGTAPDLKVTSAADLLLDVITAHLFNFRVNAASIVQINSTGVMLQSGKFGLLLGGGLSKRNGSVNTTCGAGTVIAHGLATTPSTLTATPNIAQAGSATVGIGSIGSTNFTATVGAGTSISWHAEW